MTLAGAGPYGVAPNIQFAITHGTLPTLPELTQDVAQAILAAEVQASQAWNTASALIWEGLQRGIPLALAIIQGLIHRLFATVEQFPGIHEALQFVEQVPQLRALVNTLTGADGGLVELGQFVGQQWSQIDWLVRQIVAILQAAGKVAAGDLGAAIASAETQLQALIHGSVGGGGSGFPWVFPVSFGTGSGFPWSFPVSFGSVEKTIDDVGASILTGADQAVQELKNTLVQAVTGVQTTVDHSLGDLHTAIQQLPQQPPLALVQSGLNTAAQTTQQVGAIITNSLQADAAATGAFLATAGFNAAGAVGQLNDAAVNAIGGANVAASQFGQALSGFFGAFAGAWGGGPTTAAPSQAAIDAAYAAATARAQQAQYNNSVSAQLPHFYGGSGTAGLNAEVTLAGSLAGFTTLTPLVFTLGISATVNCALYNTVAQTDSETTSGIWTSGLSVGETRVLFLRSNTGGSTLLYALLNEDAAPGPGGTHLLTWELGCFVLGVQHIISTNSLYGAPLAISALTANSLIVFEVTDYAMVFTVPGLINESVTDSTPVSQRGPSYLSGGFGDSSSIPGSLSSWAFYDSGPSAGPAAAFVATQEGTGSTSFVDLATTTDQVTVTIGASGLAIVVMNAQIVNGTAAAESAYGYALSGATNRAAALDRAVLYQTASNGGTDYRSASFLETGLAPGATTFKMKYINSGAGTSLFAGRRIAVIPL